VESVDAKTAAPINDRVLASAARFLIDGGEEDAARTSSPPDASHILAESSLRSAS
jgi:hypothetical protein